MSDEAKEEGKGAVSDVACSTAGTARKPMRALMPATAQLVDELRGWADANGLRSTLIDDAMAAGQRARREYQAQLQANGKTAADRWLRTQRFPNGCFWAEEGGREVGIRRP